MSVLRINLDVDTFERLQSAAVAERRPLPWQAEVILRQALGLPFPYPEQPQVMVAGAIEKPDFGREKAA